jgi:hypothetical protein
MTPCRVVGGFAALCALGAAAATAIDLLQGADPRWTTAANLLLMPLAAVLAASVWRTGRRPVRALAALGVVVGPLGAVLGDHAGGTWWWLALETAWWVGVTQVSWRRRPGLAVISALAAASALVATVVTGLTVAEPIASAAGVRVAMTIAWLAWASVDLVARPPGRPKAASIPGAATSPAP